MSKLDKKREKINERIALLEFELKNTLQKKTQGSAINILNHHEKILNLKKDLMNLK